MSDALSPYPAYKDSRVPWLGDIPAHWRVSRNKLFLHEVTGRSIDGSEDLLTVSQYTGVTRRSERHSEQKDLLTNAASLVGYKRVHPGNLVMNIMLAWNGSLGVASMEGITSPSYCVFHISPEIEPWYLHYLFRTPLFTGSFKTVSTGVVESRLRLYPDVFLRLSLLLPPKEEQALIVRYLDHADRQIRRLIRAKRRTIELLNEQKQAIIHLAVTRGLDLNVALKPSGVEWLGDVPAHWDVAKLQRLTTGIGDGLHGTPEYVDNSPYRFINGNNLVNGSIKFFSNTRCVSENEFRKYYIPLNSSTALLSINGTIGSVALYQGEEVILGKSAAYINCDNDLDRNYLSYFLQSSVVRQYFTLQVSGTTIFNLSLASIRSLRIALPPLAEQLEISAFLQDRMAGLTKAIERVRDEIDLIREYRTRLIADVVTGKIDVRAAAQQLPAEVNEAELWDEDASEDEENIEEVEETSPDDDN